MAGSRGGLFDNLAGSRGGLYLITSTSLFTDAQHREDQSLYRTARLLSPWFRVANRNKTQYPKATRPGTKFEIRLRV
jgi:hypothetical protein